MTEKWFPRPKPAQNSANVTKKKTLGQASTEACLSAM
jgi:hypothetical protein